MAVAFGALPGPTAGAQEVRRSAEQCTPEERQVGAIYGAVRDMANKELLPNALITVHRQDRPDPILYMIADARGAFLICGAPTDVPVVLQAHAAGRAGERERVELAPGGLHGRGLWINFAPPTRGGPSAVPATGRIVGRVVDRPSQQPVDAAVLGLEFTNWEALSSETGTFAIADVPPGQHVLRIHHIAYGDVLWPVSVPEGSTVEVKVDLSADPIELEPIVVTAERSRRLEHFGFYNRMEWGKGVGVGQFITREEIERQNPSRVSSLMYRFPRVRVDCRGGANNCYIRISGSQCPQTTFYLDGMKFRSLGEPIDRFVLPTEIAGIEVYTGFGEMAGEFADPTSLRCGTVVIWTKSGT